MRIVVASDHLPPHRSGHAVAAAWWIRALVDAGHDVTVVADAPPMELGGVTWRRLPVFPGLSPGHPLAAFRPVGRALDDLSAQSFDVIHAHGYGPACRSVLAALRSVPTVVTVHAFPEGSGTPLEAVVVPVMRRLLRTTLDNANTITVPSLAAKRQLARFVGPERAAQATILPVGVDPAFQRANRPPRGGEAARRRFLYIGRRTSSKGFDRFARLSRTHPECDWHAVGGGPSAGSTSYRVTPHVASEGVAEALARCDALLVPGLHETQGLAVLEALSCGTAVAVPKETAQAEPVTDGVHGASFEHHDDAAWHALLRAAELTRAGGVTMPDGYARDALIARLTDVLTETASQPARSCPRSRGASGPTVKRERRS